MYYIYEISKNIYWNYSNKKEFLLRIHHISDYLIGHNINDTFPTVKGYWLTVGDKCYWIDKPSREKVHYILYEDEKILNKSEIKKEAEICYDEYLRKRHNRHYSFEFRKEPVPGIRKGYFHSNYYRKVKKGKREYSIMVETAYISRRNISDKKELILSWMDDHPRSIQRNWKKYRRNQWKTKK